MNSSPERAAVGLAIDERPAAVRAVDGSIGLADIVRRVEAACDAKLRAAADEASQRTRAEVAAEVESIVRGCRGEVDALQQSLMDSAIELAAVLAEVAVQRELEEGLDLEPAVRACFERAGADASECRVRVHPDALAGLESSGVTARLEVVADPDLLLGEVRLDTPVGTVVHEPLAALDQARDALLTQLAEPHGGDAPTNLAA